MKKLSLILIVGLLAQSLSAGEFHVSVKGSDKNDGSASKPFKTISAAALIAQAGDVITVHKGTYRERVTPPRGGVSDSKRIVYQAAKGDKVQIKGSEVITGWEKYDKGVWKVTIPNNFFGNYNPYKDIINGDWFHRLDRDHHTGEVYLNGKSLYERKTLKDVLVSKPAKDIVGPEVSLNIDDQEGSTYTWYCTSDKENTYIYANFHDYNPNEELVEINVRESCFYPDKPGRNYITVRGFHMSQAATQWAAPTAEQIGLLGVHWSKGWIIEDNVISDSKCSGITLGKDRKSGHNVCAQDPSKGGAVHYNEVVVKALELGWSKDNIGSHIVRNNTIFNCEQAGICGSMGAAFCQVTNNHIYDIWTKRQFSGFEIGGIKFHAAIDTLISNNRVHNTGRGIWIDWMAQGTRVTGNLCYDNSLYDFFPEVNHGPYLADNNIFLSKYAIRDMSQGGAYAHNLVAGAVHTSPASRETPYHVPHLTKIVGLKKILGGDNRFYSNIFIEADKKISNRNDPNAERKDGYGLEVYNLVKLPMQMKGNVYYKGAKPCISETNYLEKPDFDPKIELTERGENVYLNITLDESCNSLNNKLVTTNLLGKAVIPDQAFENPDGSPLKIDSDYFGKKRNDKNTTAGPFENPGKGRLTLKVWPR
ncbi:MAG: right-handed parallel beta-helix repeat-containing protein [Planctomycetota bacterium]|jgi:hypothetical protein